MTNDFDADELAALETAGWTPGPSGPSCPDPALLVAAAAGSLEEATAAHVKAHAAGCPTCRLLAADLVEVLDEGPSDVERERIAARVVAAPVPRPVRSKRFWGFAASGVLAAAALVAFVFVRPGLIAPLHVPSPSDTGRTSATAPGSTVFHADRPNIARPEPQLTLRGDAAPVPVLEQIGGALDMADAGEMTGAISRLTEIVQREPRSAEAHLALGATLLRADRMGESLPVLENAKVLAGPAPTEEFDWFLAAALARSRDTARATAILDPLCRRPTLRGAMACAGLAEIKRTSTPR